MKQASLVLVTSILLAASACRGAPDHVSGDSGDDGGDGPAPVLEGGTFSPAGCGYTVTVKPGATAPEPDQAVLGPDPTPHQIHLGFAGPPATSMAVQWRTRDGVSKAALVQYGVDSVGEHTVPGVSFAYMPGYGSDGEMVRLHEVHLCGLAPGTTYKYRVGGLGAGGAEAWSPEYSFRTAPDLVADPSAEVTLLVLGDTRDGYDVFGGMLAKAVELDPPDVVLFTGDAVTLGPLQGEWDAYFDAAEPVLRHVPIVAAHGNHEVNSVNFFSLFMMPGDEELFAFDYGAAHIAVLNDTPVDAGDLEGRTPLFLDATFGDNAGAPWKLAMHHRPLWSASNHGSDTYLRAMLGPIYDEHRVDLVLNGHDHVYERSHPMRGTEVAASPAEGTIYVVSGGAGATLYGNGSEYWTAKSEQAQNMVILRVRPGVIDFKAYRDDGSVIDMLTLTK